ncbi:hypothetical protein COLO4_05621 [Corchorus olitorius]|uniref:Uncharacterized protein n=1 Tax=Corchorus olitorius TaxID=93759 RepID=A0A1R3KQD9_9ROSI|nr:hypothetical protein COLO4_05621 [Corchorus olitorius]
MRVFSSKTVYCLSKVSERLCEIRMKAGVFLVYGMCDEGNCEQQEMSSEKGDKREWYLVE